MPQYLLRYRQDEDPPRYFLWSTVVDAPVSRLLTADDYRDHHWFQYGHHQDGTQDGPDARLARADEFGTSAMLDPKFGAWGDTFLAQTDEGIVTGPRECIVIDGNEWDFTGPETHVLVYNEETGDYE